MKNYVYYLQWAVPFYLYAGVYLMVFCGICKKSVCGKSNRIFCIGMFASIVVVLGLTVGNSGAGQITWQDIRYNVRTANIIPIIGIVRTFFTALGGGIKDAVNLFGNILLFVPVGFFMGAFFRKERESVTFLAGAGFSLVIEIFQLFVLRAFDVDDILLNAFGIWMGMRLLKVVELYWKRLAEELTLEIRKDGKLFFLICTMLFFLLFSFVCIKS